MRRVAWSLGLLCGLVGQARAQESARLPLELSWQAPAECGSAQDVRAELERVAHALPGYALSPLRAQARVDRQERGYALRLVTEHEGERGERKLEASDCATLVRSMTLVLALAFGKGVELERGAGESAGAGESESVAAGAGAGASASASESVGAGASASAGAGAGASESDREREGERERERATASESEGVGEDAGESADGSSSSEFHEVALGSGSAARVSLLAGYGAQLVLFPEVAGYFVAAVELRGALWSIGVRGTLWPGDETALEPELDVALDGWGLGLNGCGRHAFGPFGVGLCATASGASLRGRSRGAFEDDSARAPWLALGALLGATIPAQRPIALQLEAGLAASLTRPRFVIAGFGPVHRVPLLSAQLGAALVATF